MAVSRYITRFSFAILVFLVISLVSSCEKQELAGNLSINLVQKIGDKPMILNEWLYTSPAGHPYKVRRLQLLLSDVSLFTSENEEVKFDMKHYFEFGRTETGEFQLHEIPPGSYTKIGFNFGLNEEKNLDNAYPDDYDMSNFKWPTQLGQGYHYMRFEVTADSLGSGITKDFNLHTGATYGNQNYLSILLDMDQMDVDGNAFCLDLVMDMNEWLQNPVVYDFEQFGHGIMGNQEAQEILKENGYTVFSIFGPLPQTVYSR